MAASNLGAIGLDGEFKIKYQLLNGAKPSTLADLRVIKDSNILKEVTHKLFPSSLFSLAVRNLDIDYRDKRNRYYI